VLAGEGPPMQATRVMKRFDRVKERLAKLARAQGLVD